MKKSFKNEAGYCVISNSNVNTLVACCVNDNDVVHKSAKTISFFENILKFISIFIMLIYRTIGTLHIGGGCRFEPSCSEYALTCYNRFSFLKATHLTFKRLMSCRPFGKMGYDPAPEITTELK